MLTCLYYELLVSMDHIVQLIDFILTWSITLTCDGLKRANKKSRQTLEVWHKTRLVQAFKAFSFTLGLLSQCIHGCLPGRRAFDLGSSWAHFPPMHLASFTFTFSSLFDFSPLCIFRWEWAMHLILVPSWPHFPPSIRHFPQSALSQCMTHPWIKHHWCIFNNTREDEVKGKEMHIRVLKRRKHQHEIVFWISDTVYKLTVKNMHFLPIFKNTRANSVWLENDFDWKEMCPHFDTWTVLDMRELPSRYGIRTFQIGS